MTSESKELRFLRCCHNLGQCPQVKVESCSHRCASGWEGKVEDLRLPSFPIPMDYIVVLRPACLVRYGYTIRQK